MKAGVVIVGLGQIGMGYDEDLDLAFIYSHCRAFEQHPAFDIVAGIDLDPAKRALFEERFGAPAYADVGPALAKHRGDVVVIATPTTMHEPVLREVLAVGQARVVLCEKPLALEPNDAVAMVNACDTRGVALYVNYIRRSDPGVIETKRRLDSGEIGTPVKGVVWYGKGFFHSGSHFFNLMQYWLGSMEASAVLDVGRLWDGHDPEPDVRVVFERGTMVFLAAREEAFSHYTAELLSPTGRLRYEQGGARIEWQAAQPDPRFVGYTALAAQPEAIRSGMDRYQWHVADQLARALAGADAHLCSGREALETLESMHKLMERR